MNKPFMSIIIPLQKLSSYLINENLPEMEKQSYKNFEVIVLPNKTSKEDKKLILKYPWLRIIPTGKITRPAEKRDIGAKNSKGSILAFIDDDAYPSSDWLEKSVYYFETKKTEVICGPGILPPKTNIWEKIFDEILINPIGSGEYQYRFVQKDARYIDDYPSMNFFIQKKVFQELGGFNSKYWPGEDSKLCEDLTYKYKGKIYYNPNILVYHHRRDNLISFLKQHANYGFHRGAFFAHGDRNSRRLSYLVPPFFVLYIFFLIISIFFNIQYRIPNIEYRLRCVPLLIYFLIGLFLTLKSYLKTKNIIIFFTTFLFLFLTHFTYGIMFIQGFFTGLFKKKHIYA